MTLRAKLEQQRSASRRLIRFVQELTFASSDVLNVYRQSTCGECI